MAILSKILSCQCGQIFHEGQNNIVFGEVKFSPWETVISHNNFFVMERTVSCGVCNENMFVQKKNLNFNVKSTSPEISFINDYLFSNNFNYLEKAFENSVNTSALSYKIFNLQHFALDVLNSDIKGDVVECGVYKGGSSRLLSTIFSDRRILLFDSFQGMLEEDTFADFSYFKKGDFGDSDLSFVKNYLEDRKNCSFYPGWIPESTNFLTDEKFCFVFLDLDLYQSTKNAIDVFWPRLNIGGFMAFDDYDTTECPGVKQSILEFFPDSVPHVKYFSPYMCFIKKL